MKTKKLYIRQFSNLALLTAITVTVWSCRVNEKDPEGDFVNGVIVANQGNFLSNNGTLSYFKREDATSQDDIFQKANGQPLNAGVQAYAEAGEYGIILADHSDAGRDRVEIVEKNTFKKVATFSSPDIENPVDVLAVSDHKVYVSCWGTTGVFPNFYINPGYIAVIDLTTKTVTKKITLEKGSDKMALAGTDVYVGSSDYITALSVIDTKTDAVTQKINTGLSPQPIGTDVNGKMWISSELKLIRINTASYTVESTLTVGSDPLKVIGNFAFSPDREDLVFNYYGYNINWEPEGETISLPVESNQVNISAPIIKRTFNSLNIDPMQGLIYGSVVPSYTQSGYMVRYYLNGDLKDSIKVGISPKQAVFK